ncbi:RpnC/YadD family protein [Thermodesulfovibrio hydrogeniphilus]
MSNEAFQYDRTIRELIQSIPLRFTEILTGMKVTEILDTTFPKVDERVADFIGRLEDGTIIHIELQVQNDPNLPERMINYFLRIRTRYGQNPWQMILWLADGKCPYEEHIQIGPLSFSYTVKDIKEIDCRVLLESEDPNDNILAVLCRRGEGFWERLIEKLRELPEGKRRSYIQKLLYLIKLRKDILQEYATLLKEVNKMPLPIVIPKEQDPFYIEGIERGIQKGLILDAQELVIEALEERFGFVGGTLKEKIKSIQERDVLKRLHRLAIRASSIEEFEEKMDF